MVQICETLGRGNKLAKFADTKHENPNEAIDKIITAIREMMAGMFTKFDFDGVF